MGVPGLKVLAPSALGDPGLLLERAVLETEDPVLFIENKLLYLLPTLDGQALSEFNLLDCNSPPSPFSPVYTLGLRGAPPPALTLAAYGHMAELARQAALRLAYEHEIFVELVVPTQLAPFSLDPLLDSARRTGRLLVVEEGTLTLGWGAEVLARCAEALGARLQSARRLAALDLPVPASGPLESAALPGVDKIVALAKTLA
jgi:pyruvate/2-oxoglutarate/acetoin dehydrogenase E1 component